MERKRKSPQQKKRESYTKDRRNTYGENAKASRRGIARKKRRQNRHERRVAHEALPAPGTELDLDRIDEATARVRRLHRGVWRLKFPDEPLAEVVAQKLRRRAKLGIVGLHDAEAKLERIRRLTKR